MALVLYQFVGMTDQSLDTRAPAARVRERRHARPLRSDPPGRRHRRRCHRCQMERTQQKTPRVALFFIHPRPPPNSRKEEKKEQVFGVGIMVML